MPWWGWLIISVMGAIIIGLVCWIAWFVSGLERGFRRAFM